MQTETIAAIATAPGQGGVGIIRVSGPKAKSAAKQILGFVPEPRLATLTNFKTTQGDVLDKGIALFFEGPNSFTGEDTLELQAHGGSVLLDMLLAEALKNKHIRLAKAGEFTEQAFLNNKLDLTQAEAIADLIAAESEAGAKAAMCSLQGEFSRAISQITQDITELRVYVEAALDFAEEDIDFLADNALIKKSEDTQKALIALLGSANQGALMREGMRVVLIGRPNAGKSSLLNQLSGETRAIVTDVAGTTRDVLRETIVIDGLPIQVIDTAGLRESEDKIEQIGIAHTWQTIEIADVVLHLVDATAPKDAKENEILENLPKTLKTKTVYTKTDLNPVPPNTLGISNKTGKGLEALKAFLHKAAGFNPGESGKFSARRRHVDALEQAQQHMYKAHEGLLSGTLPELVAQDYALAQKALGAINGKATPDDLLGEIFSSFCIGK